MNDSPRTWVSIRSDALRAEIDPLGAQLSLLQDGTGQDLLWNGDPAVWAGRAPILFPIVGALVAGRYRVGGTSFALSRHGFARGKPFSVEASTESSAAFRLTADDSTLAVYPFRFALDIAFELHAATLSVTSRVSNRGTVEMPASLGYHPAFRWPLPFGQPRGSHVIEFEADEPAGVRRIDSAGLLTPQRHATPVVRKRLKLTDALFQDDVLIFDRLASRAVTYGCASGPRIRVQFPDAPFLGLWSKPGAPFICIEPWHGVTDEAGFSGDFRDKLGVFVLAPGASLSTTMLITLLGS